MKMKLNNISCLQYLWCFEHAAVSMQLPCAVGMSQYHKKSRLDTSLPYPSLLIRLSQWGKKLIIMGKLLFIWLTRPTLVSSSILAPSSQWNQHRPESTSEYLSNLYSISQEMCTRFCCALLCCGYAIVHNEFTWSIYPYSSGLLCWHWGNR